MFLPEKKKWLLCDGVGGSWYYGATIFRFILAPNQYAVPFKLTQCYVSVISQ